MSSEANEWLPAGPRGVQGERGERGLSRRVGWAIVVLFVFCAAGITGNLLWTAHSVDTEQGKWCGLVVTLDQANEAAKKPPAPGTFTAQLVAEIHDLRKSLKCEPTP